MAGSLGELFIQLAFEGDTKGAEDFKKSLKDVETGAGALIKAIQELTAEVKRLVDIEMKKAVQTADDHAQAEKADTNAVIDNTNAVIDNAEAEKNAAETNQDEAAAKEAESEAEKENTKETNENTKAKQKNQKEIKKIAKEIAGYIAAVSGAIFAVKKLTDSLIQNNQTWLNLTRTSDIALSTFQKWNAIGRMYGIDNAAQQIKNLNDRLFELKLTGANGGAFTLLGGGVPQDAEALLEMVRQRISGLDDTAASYLLRQLGIDENMLHVLRLSREEFKALNAEVKRFQLTPDQRKNIQEMNVQLQIASMKLQYLKDRAVLAILPAWTKFISSIARVSVMLAHAAAGIGRFIKQFRGVFIIFGAWLVKTKPVIEFFKKFGGIIKELIGKIPIFGRLLGGIAGAVAKWLWPLTAAYLLLDDIAVTMQGGDSLIGDLFKYIKQIGSDFSNIFASFKLDPLQGLLNIIIEIGDVLANTARVILRFFEIITGIPAAKWFDEHLMNDDYKAGIEQWRDRLQKNSLEAQYGDPLRGGYSEEDYNALIAEGNRKKAERLHNSIISPQTERAIDNSITNNNTSNAPKIEFNQKVDINSSQPARDTYNEFQNGLFFANNTLVRGAAI